MAELLLNRELYETVILEKVPFAKKSVLIGTADIKDMHVQRGKHYMPFLAVLADLVQRGVFVKLIHAKEPGPRFREDFDSHPQLINSPLFKRVLCPRVHFKMIIIDEKFAYSGSANLTGAGLGAKSSNRRNFEVGVITEEKPQVRRLLEFYREIFRGSYCARCERRMVCPDPIQ